MWRKLCLAVSCLLSGVTVHAAEPTLVEITASWCPFCRKIDPDVKALMRAGYNIVQADYDVKANEALAATYFDLTKTAPRDRTLPAFFVVDGKKITKILPGDIRNLNRYGMKPKS